MTRPILLELARCNNLELYIQPDPFLGTDIGHLHRPYTHVPHQGVLSIDFGKQSNLTQFNVSNDMLRPTGVAGARSIRRRGRQILRSRLTSTELPMGL